MPFWIKSGSWSAWFRPGACSDNGSEFLNWPLRIPDGPSLKVPDAQPRLLKNDNAHCSKTGLVQLLGYHRFAHPQLVPLLNDLYSKEWSLYQNHFRPTFKLLRRDRQGGKTIKTYEKKPHPPYQRLLESPQIPEPIKARLRAQHAALDPFALKKRIEAKLKIFFTVLGNLDRESTKT